MTQTRDQHWTFDVDGAFVQAVLRPLPTLTPRVAAGAMGRLTPVAKTAREESKKMGASEARRMRHHRAPGPIR